MSDRIRGQVAEILSNRELALNRGEEHGVEVGMRFAILNRKGADIRDPETGESLGEVEIAKTIVKVIRVQERLCVARTFKTRRVGGGISTSFFEPARTVTETLRIGDRPYVEELDESESYVKRGDPAVQVVGDEYGQVESE